MSRLKGNIGARSKRRFVTKIKWELPFRDSKPYWKRICDDIESKVLKRVRNSSSSIPISYPVILSPSIRYSVTSSVSRDDISTSDFSKRHLATGIANGRASEPTIKAALSSDSASDTKLPRDSVKFSSDLVEYFNERAESSDIQFRLTKLSMITRLVNDFLASTCTQVSPTSGISKNFSSPTDTSSESYRNRTSSLSEKSFDDRSKEDSEYESLIGKMARKEANGKAGTFEVPMLNEKSLAFPDDDGRRVEKDFDSKDNIVARAKPSRARAPSLSVASTVPSFGRVVISIEDIDSTENEKDYVKSKDKPLDPSNLVTSKDYEKTIDLGGQKIDDRKPTQDFLKVPEVGSTGSASYPIYERSKYQAQNASLVTGLTEETYEFKLLRESQKLKDKYRFWPKRSIVNVCRALKTMKTRLRSKARIESETNQFFASPLEIYSPSARSSISSDGDANFMNPSVPESTLGQNDDDDVNEDEDDRNGSRENIDIKFDSSSYASVHKRLMLNAVAHLSKNSQRDAAATCIDTHNARKATYEQANPSSFYNSWATSKDTEKLRHEKTLKRPVTGIPRVGRIFPRIKADKCLACMCQSLKDIDEPRLLKTAGTFFDYMDEDALVLSHDESSSEIKGFDFSTETCVDHFYRDRYKLPLSTDKSLSKSTAKHYLAGSLTPVPRNDCNFTPDVEDSRSTIHKTVIETLRSGSQVEDLQRSRAIGKSPSKTLTSAKSLVTSLSLVSERSRSISDQDDSDQGCVDPAANDIGFGSGSISKYLAPYHMPINLKPSLEPLKALRCKKSRSIRSRVASAEKSVDSASNDDAESDYEENIVKQPLNVAQNKLATGKNSMQLGSVNSSEDEKMQKIVSKDSVVPSGEQTEANQSQTIVGSKETISSKIDNVDNAVKNNNDDVPIISDREVIEISQKCLDNNKTITEILQVLDSKSYLNREKRPNNMSDLSFSSKQPGLCNSRQLRRILPLKSYNLVAPILGMAEWYPTRKISNLGNVARRASRMDPNGKSRETAFDLTVHSPSRLEQNVSFEKCWKDRRPKLSPYSLFLMKPRRKAVTWRPLTDRDLEGYDSEATLKMRAAKLTDRICEDFYQWLESLAVGTNQTSNIDVEVLKDMFETDFTAEVCSTMQVSIKEMPMVPIAVAVARNFPGAGELALTRRHLVTDARAETRPKKTIGFGTSLPGHLKFVPPRNRVNEKWLQCENVPKDLETMEAVWKDITHLTSVKGFVNWLRAHPEVKRPKTLEKVLTSRRTIGTRQSVVSGFKQSVAPDAY